jgi:hypothetical protein
MLHSKQVIAMRFGAIASGPHGVVKAVTSMPSVGAMKVNVLAPSN